MPTVRGTILNIIDKFNFLICENAIFQWDDDGITVFVESEFSYSPIQNFSPKLHFPNSSWIFRQNPIKSQFSMNNGRQHSQKPSTAS